VALEDRVDLVVHVVVELHLDQLWVLADRQVKQLLRQHKLLTLTVELLVSNLALLQLVDSLFQRYR